MYIISVFIFRWILYLSMFYIIYLLNKKLISSFYIHAPAINHHSYRTEKNLPNDLENYFLIIRFMQDFTSKYNIVSRNTIG